jgi:hypothetical protein
MEDRWLARIRWRRRGAWMWPSFIALTVLDGLIGSALPPSGEGWNFVGAALFGCFANLVAIVALSVPLRFAIRRVRPDLPKVVAMDYAGTTVMAAISAVLLAAGIVHRPQTQADQRVMADAIVRAQAFIGDRAPARFRRNVEYVNTFTIQAGSIYRMCVPSIDRAQTYCVIVRTKLPLARSVIFDGYESNAVFGAGVN